MNTTVLGKVGHARPWIVSGLTLEQAEEKYKDKDFIVAYEPERVVMVHVNSVEVRGGVTLAYASVVKPLRRYKNTRLAYAKNESIYAGRLEDIKIGGTI